jgi:UDPglucose 6-dehydrogenase
MSSDKNVTIIGIGRLGICFALVLAKKGFTVVGVDISQSYVDNINNKTLKSNEPFVEQFLQETSNLRATTSIDEGISHSDTIFILVDTPSSGNENYYDHSKLGSVLMALNQRKIENKHIVIGCTVIPGYIAKVGRFLISDTKNCTLSYNPEFIAQGNIINGQLRPDMVLIGQQDSIAGDRLQYIYECICENNPYIARMSPESAEICKLAVNCFVTMKIAYCNLIGDIADTTPNANKYDICHDVGNDSRVGLKCLIPGYGFGGPCFPRDNRALNGYAKSIGINSSLFASTDECNRQHTEFQTAKHLSENKSNYEFVHVAYKPGTRVPIIEESQKLRIAAGLARAGKCVTVCDYVNIINEVKKEYGNLFHYKTI